MSKLFPKYYHSDVCYRQHDGQRQLEEGVPVEGAEVGQREEADSGHQVDLETVEWSDTVQCEHLYTTPYSSHSNVQTRLILLS